MILGIHGAFDSRTDPDCGFSKLMARIRSLSLSDNVREQNVSQPGLLSEFELTLEPNIYIGYSNGGDVVHSRLSEHARDTE